MKKLVILFLVIILGIVGIKTIHTKKPLPQVAGIQSITHLAASPTPTEKVIATPTRLIIPSISVNAPIESVGMDEKGNMAVPEHADNAAWYNLGFKPGENGSAVIDGHYDKVTGAPAVFYNLGSLKNGDIVQIKESDGSILTFNVTSSKAYPFDQLPLQKIFNSPGTPTLNLITCDGIFNKAAKNYSERLVVYTKLAEK